MSVDVDSLYRRYGPMVLRRCRQLLGNDESAALDAMQDTFVLLLRAEDRLVEDAPGGLLYRMATNVCLNRIRTKKRRPETRDEELLADLAQIDDAESRTLAGRVLDRVFGREPESTRVIAVLHLVDGLTHEEVASEVGMSVSGVRKRLRTLVTRVRTLEGASL